MIRSYEIGVLFIPSEFEAGAECFKVISDIGQVNRKGPGDSGSDGVLFPVPYDFPLVEYFKQDRPWIWDIPYVDKPDTHGTKWCPSLR